MFARAPIAFSSTAVLLVTACGGSPTGGASDVTTVSTSDAETSESGTSSGDPSSDGDGDGDPTGDGDPSGDGDGDGDPALACAWDVLGEADAVAPSEHVVGPFTVAIDSGGRLSAWPSAEPEHLVLTPAGTGAMIEAAEVELLVEEHQGSFDVGETVVRDCKAPRADQVRYRDQGDSAVLVVEGGFDDPACASLRYQVCVSELDGQLGVRVETDDPSVTRLSLRVGSDANERIYGAGEQFPHDRLDLKGRTIPVLAQEGGIGRGHGVISPAVDAFSEGSAGSEAATYYAAPQFVSSRLRSLYVEEEAYTELDFEAATVTEVRVHAPTLHARVIHGDSPLALIEGFTEFAGRMPVPPAWVNDGAIVALARPLPESAQIVADLRAAGAEIAAVWNQTWSGVSETFIGEQVLWNWTQNPNDHPGWAEFVADMAAEDIRVLCYVNSMLREVPEEALPVPRNLFEEAIAGDYFVHDSLDQPYMLPVTAFDVGLVDLSNPEAWDWMKAVLQDELYTKAGCSGWMADFAEALPFDAVMADGVPAAIWHNRYPVEWARLNREAIEEAGLLGEVLIFNRSGHTRSPRYSLLLWEGDQLTTWDKYDGLVSALHGLISAGFSGVALNHSDTGGYTSLSWLGLGYDREAEQLKRWTEMNAFTAVLRTHEGNQPDLNAQIYSDAEARAHFARFTKVYKALGFYRAQLFAEARDHGWPVVRHLWLHYPDDATAQTIDDQFLLGSEILVAPIKNKCWTWPLCPYDKQVYLPAGQWVHLWSGEVFGNPDQGGNINVAAPLGEPAVFYALGSPIAGELVGNLQAAGITVPNPP